MEKVSFVQNGMVKLPPGFRFHPTDEELVVQYLGRKVFSYPLPAAIIPELDLCKFDPWDLPGNYPKREKTLFFFSFLLPSTIKSDIVFLILLKVIVGGRGISSQGEKGSSI